MKRRRMQRRRMKCTSTSTLIAIAAVVALVVTACGGSTSVDTRALDATAIPTGITVTSPEFTNNGTIPRANTCDGAGTEPTITWGPVPARAKSVAVVVDDQDGPKGHDFLQWLVIGLPPTAGSVPSHAPGVSELDNTGGTRGWSAPCPTAGTVHHYRFSVYALADYVCADNGDSSNGPDCSAPSSVQALPQISGTAIARGVLVGTVTGARSA
jgi:Raf kinase inhibitor-like YbhB/YbcL family protein